MPRLPRLYVPGCPQHIIQRGNNRQACFFADSDYSFYLSKLNEARKKFNVKLHAFVLMINHVHLLATPSNQSSISKMMQSLGRNFTGYINSTYQRTGSLWEGRYKSTLLDSDQYLLTVSRYIELNPVRANMVSHAFEYPWSSYHSNALGKHCELLHPHDCYLALGATPEERQNHYRERFNDLIEEKTLNDIREATNKSWALGDNHFKEEINKIANRRVESMGWGGNRKSILNDE